MSEMPAARGAATPVPTGTRGPNDDFYCHKYEVWYRVEDCVYRGRNRTYPGCVNCFQGHVNIRSVEKGVQPPAFLGSAAGEPHEPRQGDLLELKWTR